MNLSPRVSPERFVLDRQEDVAVIVGNEIRIEFDDDVVIRHRRLEDDLKNSVRILGISYSPIERLVALKQANRQVARRLGKGDDAGEDQLGGHVLGPNGSGLVLGSGGED